jgi:Tol biopolymer transport system component
MRRLYFWPLTLAVFITGSIESFVVSCDRPALNQSHLTLRVTWLVALGLSLVAASSVGAAPRTTRATPEPVGELVYSEGYICTVNADGSRRRCLTRNDHGEDYTAVWSADGRHIAFERQVDSAGPGERALIVVMSSNGATKRAITPPGDFFDAGPAWSPVAPEIAFSRLEPKVGAKPGMFLSNADGSGQRKIMSSALSPAWSPDGRKIAFLREVASRTKAIYVMNADGSGSRQVRRPGIYDNLAWSPDGRLLSFDRLRPKDDSHDVYVMKPNGTGLRRLTHGPTDNNGSAWAPDGRRMAFTCAVDVRQNVCVVNADGTGFRRLTFRGPYNFAPAWSPDGHWIAFVRYPTDDSLPKLYVMQADGKRARRITPYTLDLAPAWAPK